MNPLKAKKLPKGYRYFLKYLLADWLNSKINPTWKNLQTTCFCLAVFFLSLSNGNPPPVHHCSIGHLIGNHQSVHYLVWWRLYVYITGLWQQFFLKICMCMASSHKIIISFLLIIFYETVILNLFLTLLFLLLKCILFITISPVVASQGEALPGKDCFQQAAICLWLMHGLGPPYMWKKLTKADLTRFCVLIVSPLHEVCQIRWYLFELKNL